MRTSTKSGIALQYPEEIAFAFLPFRLILTGSNISAIQINMTCVDNAADAKYNAFNGKCYCDVREYVQGFFDGVEWGFVDYDEQETIVNNLCKNVSVSVNATLNDDTTIAFAFTCNVVWGGLKIGESWNKLRKMTKFVGYPFSVDFYSNSEDGTYIIGRNGQPNSIQTLGGIGINTKVLDNSQDDARTLHIFSNGSTITQATFDKTYDLTFYNTSSVKTEEIVRIYVREENYDHPYYLRWIDRHGFMNYYLFKTNGDYTTSAASNGDYSRNNILYYEQSSGYQWHGGRNKSYTRNDSIQLCAPLVDSDIFDSLMDLTTSPVVDLYLGDRWTPVLISEGEYTKAKDDLQDFICTLNLPAVPTQTL